MNVNTWALVSRSTLQSLRIGGSKINPCTTQLRLFGAQPAPATTTEILTRRKKLLGPNFRCFGKVSEEVTKETPSLKPTDSQKISVDSLYKTIELEVLAYEPSVLDSYQWFVITAARHLDINVGKCWSPLKSDKLRFPVLKSAFVHKKHKIQYEIRTHHRFITLHKLTGSTAETFLEYIERNLPEGLGLKVTRVEVQPLPEYLQKHS